MRTEMDCRSLGERASNYTTGTTSSVHQMKQKDTTSSKSKAEKAGVGAGGFAAGLLAGAGVGVLAGLLLAPDKGTTTRRKVSESTKKYSGQVTDWTNQATQWAKKQMNKGGGQSDAQNDTDVPPTTATGRAVTSTGGPAHSGGTTHSAGTTQNSPYTDPNKRSDSEVKSMINDPKKPGATNGPSIPPTV